MRKHRYVAAMMVVTLAMACAVCGEDAEMLECPIQRDGVFVLSPMIGQNRNELKIPGRGPMPAMTLSDTETEYGLYAMFAHPRVVVNSFLFYTEPNSAEVSGNMTFLNLYGPRDKRITWNAGAGYLWHKIATEGPAIEVTAPMLKAGAVIRLPALRMTLNPYLGYVWENVDTGSTEEQTESVLYGITAKWQWRMLHATLKYYLSDDLDRNEQYNVFRARLSAFFHPHFGVMGRFEMMEHSTSDDTSWLVGPVVVF